MALLADGAAPLRALVDTGTPISIWNDPSDDPEVKDRTIHMLAATAAHPLRGRFGRVKTVGAALAEVGDGSLRPTAILGGNFLVDYTVEIGFGAPEIIFWSAQPATDSYLSGVGYAVLHAKRRGGGELDVRGPSGGIGPRGPYQYPSSLLVVRACAAPSAFVREDPLPTACCSGDERALATGVDLSLVLATGTGPTILGRSAWARIEERLPTPPARRRAPLRLATIATPIDAEWAMLPRLALVDREAEVTSDPGPCVELGRARRLEQVAFSQAQNAEHAACVLPCDQDPNTNRKALNGAGYLELGDAIEVAIIDDREPLLQTLRQQIRPEGPEVNGVLGAAALRNARLELDYSSERIVAACEAGVPSNACRAVGRCPRLPGAGQTHSCFGLAPHGLPGMCDNPPSCPSP